MKRDLLPLSPAQWGEGPVWWKDRFYFVDIEGHCLRSYDPRSGEESVWPVDQRIGFALPCVSEKWIWGGDHGFYFLDLSTGHSTPITNPEAHLPDNRFNDAAVSPDGRLFAGSIALKKAKGTATLYRMDSRLKCEVAFPNVTNSNGLAWSPDGKTCYYIDTPSYQVRRFEYDPDNGELKNEQTAFRTDSLVSASPDGMCMDAEGNLWIAFCHGGCVIKFDPHTGKILQQIDLPAVETTSCSFGGHELRDLYVTTGISSKHSEADAGKVFVIRNAAQGLPQTAFRDI
ncbi:MAG: SMP-30/gluconolactonase/LRE family protein [Kiritimatiellia bacterium]